MQETEVVLSVLRARGSRARGINRWRARCIERMHAGFGGRLHGKGLHPHGIRDLAVQPTLPGVATGHEVRESRNKGEGAQVITILRTGRSAECRALKLS